jgi:hypothetical protein
LLSAKHFSSTALRALQLGVALSTSTNQPQTTLNLQTNQTMKKTLITLALLASAVVGFAQGTLQIGNSFTGVFRAPIYGVDPADATRAQSGQSALGNPAGTTVYGGPLVQGTGFTFALFAGAAGSAEGALQLVTTATFSTSASGALPAGLIVTQTLPINGVAPGAIAALQVRVWDNKGGTVST